MRKLFLFILALICVSVAARAETVLFLRNSIEVSSNDILLKDLLKDLTLIPSDWQNRAVLSAPAAGEVNYHSLTTIAHGLARYDDMKAVTLRGEPVIQVSRRDRKLNKEEFHDPLLSYLNRSAPWKGNDVDISVVNIPKKTRVPDGETEYRVTRIDQKTSKGYSMAYVTVVVDGEDALEVPVGVEINFLTEVWVTAHSLERGHIINEDDLRSEMHVIDATGNHVSSKEIVVGHEVNRVLTPGSILKRNSISKPMCAKRGEWVAINAIGNNLHITLRGKAMANGRLGDRIMCVNERSHRQVLVELTGSGNGILVRL